MQRLSKFFISIIIFVLTALHLASCGQGESYSSTSFTCFNTEVYVSVKGELDEQTKNEIKTTLFDLENKVSLTRDSSDMKKFNENSSVTVSDQTAYLISRAKECFDLTLGKFNPAVLPLLDLYRLSSSTYETHYIRYSPPLEIYISDVLTLCDFNSVTLDQENKVLSKSKEGVRIDLGGITKGYAVDLIKDILSSKGLLEGFINVGGSSIYVLDYDKNLSVKHPRENGKYILSIDCKNIKNSPLSTSGDYVRCYIDDDGNRYSHIIDSKTGKTVNTGFSSVTLIANGDIQGNKKSALFTDAISTSLMLMEKEEMINFVKDNLIGFTVYAVYEKDGTRQIITNADEGFYSIVDASYSLFKF